MQSEKKFALFDFSLKTGNIGGLKLEKKILQTAVVGYIFIYVHININT